MQLWPAQEVVREGVMRGTSVRVFRVIDYRGPFSKTLVFEYVERGEFNAADYNRYVDEVRVEAATKRDEERDTWNVLSYLKGTATYGQHPDSVKTAHSIDEAVAQGEERSRELKAQVERLLGGGLPIPPAKPGGSGHEKPLILSPSGSSTEIEKEVWDYAGGRRLRWEPAGRTPGGLDYEVLTVDDVELLYPGTTTLETSPPKPR